MPTVGWTLVALAADYFLLLFLLTTLANHMDGKIEKSGKRGEVKLEEASSSATDKRRRTDCGETVSCEKTVPDQSDRKDPTHENRVALHCQEIAAHALSMSAALVELSEVSY